MIAEQCPQLVGSGTDTAGASDVKTRVGVDFPERFDTLLPALRKSTRERCALPRLWVFTYRRF
jgi:hypothetical protein